jgi:hypothetical protein
MLKTAFKGKNAIIYQFLLQMMTGVMQLAMFMALFAAATAISQDLESITGFSAASAWKWNCFLGIPAGAFWVFSAACRVQIWREFDAADASSQRKDKWMVDLPAIMGIDLITTLLRNTCIITMMLAVFGILFNASKLGMFITAISALLLFCLEIVTPAWTSERILSGNQLGHALIHSLQKIIQSPIKALACYLIPNIMTITAICALPLQIQAGNLTGMLALLAVAILIPCFIPMCWLGWMRNQTSVSSS